MKILKITDWETCPIIQTWTRNMISNDLENAQIAAESKDIISDETILKNHSWVENPEEEMKRMKTQNEEKIKKQQEIFGNSGGFDKHGEEE